MASILKIVITQNTICDNLVGFPKSGHKCTKHSKVYNYEFLARNTNISTLSGLSEALCSFTIFPDLLNNLSSGTLVAGTACYF